MKIKKQADGQTLIILLITVTIMALLAFDRSGMLNSLMGTKDKPGTVRVDLNKIQQQTDEYNNRVKQQMNADTNGLATTTATSSDY